MENKTYFIRYHCQIHFDRTSQEYFHFSNEFRRLHIENIPETECTTCKKLFKFNTLQQYTWHVYTQHIYKTFDCRCGLEFPHLDSLFEHLKLCRNQYKKCVKNANAQ